MANVNADNYAKSINPSQSNRNDPGSVGGRVRSLTDVIELTAQPANDTINIGKDLVPGAIIHAIQIDNDALGAGVILDIGDAVDPDRYINGYDANANLTNEGAVAPVGGEMQIDGKHFVITELTETIIVRNQPDEFSVRYDAPGVRTECVNQFIAVDDQKTRWEATNIITFSGVFRLFGWMMKGRIFERIQADLRRFKALAESTPEN